MANAKIDILGPNDLSVVTDLYNQVFKPSQEQAFFERRFHGRHNALIMVGSVEEFPVGFFLGFELKPTVFFAWLYGVVTDHRRQGIASQLMGASEDWAKQHGYEAIRMECHNNNRAMLHMGIEGGYNITGIRWDADRSDNLVILERFFTD